MSRAAILAAWFARWCGRGWRSASLTSTERRAILAVALVLLVTVAPFEIARRSQPAAADVVDIQPARDIDGEPMPERVTRRISRRSNMVVAARVAALPVPIPAPTDPGAPRELNGSGLPAVPRRLSVDFVPAMIDGAGEQAQPAPRAAEDTESHVATAQISKERLFSASMLVPQPSQSSNRSREGDKNKAAWMAAPAATP